jgi:indolepyruvate ferredoxin oxidoreductase beta subunit
MAGAELVAHRADAADWVRRLRQAALLDEAGEALDGALKTIATLAAS